MFLLQCPPQPGAAMAERPSTPPLEPAQEAEAVVQEVAE